MDSRLYVGNLHPTLDSFELSQLFEEYGNVLSAQIITSFETGQSKGFGFVEMGSSDEAVAAAAALDGKECIGRILSVHRAADLGVPEGTSHDAVGPQPGGFGDRGGTRPIWGNAS